MRIIGSFSFILFFYFVSNSQVFMTDRIRFKDTVMVKKYIPTQNGFNALKVSMSPGGHHVLHENSLKKIKNQTIVGIDLVYTDYPKNANLHELNRARIIEIYKHLPQAFDRGMVEWRIIKQTGVHSKEQMKQFFHGCVVYYRPFQGFGAEQEEISDVLNGKAKPKDSTLLKVFHRNKDWKNMLVVCDVTGSMSPYTAQLLLWIKANQKMKTFKQIVFFNDDDNRSTTQENGLDQTGIWPIESENSNKVIQKAFEAMEKGQHEENNLEAICYAIKKFPENKENVVMIADNWEDPCDMKLLHFLEEQKIPVKIVVCGVVDRINLNYLKIAHKTGGSVHTMEEDLYNISKIGEGQTFKIGKMRFKMSRGTFIQLNGSVNIDAK